MKPKSGFTLIELLIVVAIIGILAAIAVPNFINARTKAVLSRVQADMRALSTAAEMYMLDHGTYPRDAWRGYIYNYTTARSGWIAMTTPVSYISASTFIDPFKVKFADVDGIDRQFGDALYEMGTGNSNQGKHNEWPFTDYILVSIGPDSGLGREHADDSSLMADYPFSSDLYRFDITNGLTSNGDIYTFKGGQPAPTVARVDGVPWPR